MKNYFCQYLACQINLGSFFSLVMSKIFEVFSSLEVCSGVGGGALHPWDVLELKCPESQAEVPLVFLAIVGPR